MKRDGLDVAVYRIRPSDPEYTETDDFRFPHRIHATFRFDNVSAVEVRHLTLVLVMRAVVALLDTYPGMACWRLMGSGWWCISWAGRWR